MANGRLVALSAAEVASALEGRESDVLETVAQAYRMHARGETSLPHSTFLRFPELPANRIIALPAYLGGPERVAGIKWIASAPANIHRGLERASAVILLNCPETGRPWGLLEGAAISAARTAASAALAARELHGTAAPSTVGLIGCGRINAEVMTYLRLVLAPETPFLAFDLDLERSERFADAAEMRMPGTRVSTAGSLEEVLGECPLVVFATTAVEPHVADLGACPPGATILHLSLRDLAPEAILASDNVVDDLDHVCRAQTSIHLTEQHCGHRDFVSCSLGEILNGAADARPEPRRTTVFSPFGLGVLDIAVARRIHHLAVEQGLGTVLDAFLPAAAQDPVPAGARAGNAAVEGQAP